MATKKNHPMRFAAEPATVAKFRNLCYAKGLSANRVVEAFMEKVIAAEHDEPTLTGLIGKSNPRPKSLKAVE